MDNIYLTGMMGSGKTTVAEQLAAYVGSAMKETDACIVDQEGISINEIFATNGEPYFRALEKKVLRELAAEKDLVISTGGGIILDEENRELMRETGTVIYLKTAPEVLCTRLEGATDRPLLKGNELKKKIDSIFAERKEYYETATVIIDTTAKSVNEVIDDIIAVLKKEKKI